MESIRILVVEDYALQREYLISLLRETLGAKVDGAASGYEAEECLAQQPYELLLLDLNMPEMDGVQFIQQVASRYKDTALALVSACDGGLMQSVQKLALLEKVAVVGCYNKPFMDSDLPCLREAWEQFQQRGLENDAELLVAPVALPIDAKMLKQAFLQEEFVAGFQPKLSLTTGKITGVETLVRWHHSSKGVLSPAVFLRELEQAKLEGELLRYMLGQALAAHRKWRDQGYTVPIAVNLPAHLLSDASLPDQLGEMLDRAKVDAQWVTLELLESSMATGLSDALSCTGRLRLKGFKLAQDDFGVGYSSVAALLSLPFTELKIDRRFVNGVANNTNLQSVVRSTIFLAKQLGLSVTAEGVETEADKNFLQQERCDSIQGYYFSEALPEDELLSLLHKHKV